MKYNKNSGHSPQEVSLMKKKLSHSGGSGGTDDYRDLSNKPKINGVELNGNKTSDVLGLADKILFDALGQTVTQLSTRMTNVESGKLNKNQPSGSAGDFLVLDSNKNITTMTLQTWQGGNY